MGVDTIKYLTCNSDAFRVTKVFNKTYLLKSKVNLFLQAKKRIFKNYNPTIN